MFEVAGIDHLLFLSDVAFITYPTLEDKVHIIENTVAVAQACGVACPKVAPLAAVEVVNPKMPCTVDADALRQMNAEGKITGCVVDGPLSMDIAIAPEAAAHKGASDRPAAGPCRRAALPRYPGRQHLLQDPCAYRRLQKTAAS